VFLVPCFPVPRKRELLTVSMSLPPVVARYLVLQQQFKYSVSVLVLYRSGTTNQQAHNRGQGGQSVVPWYGGTVALGAALASNRLGKLRFDHRVTC
jgi:hypothetical protein